MEKTLAALMEEIRQNHLREKPLYDARLLTGERFAIPREGVEPVDVILYRPAESPAGPTPMLLNMHGGGFIGGDAVLMDSFCRMLADALGMLVVNVNYKKAPEYAFPYAIQEVTDTAEYFVAHAGAYGVDPARIAVGGHSAGASLAAGAALKARDDGRISLACQLLVYPCTDLLRQVESSPEEAESYRLFQQLYCQHDEQGHLWASPLLAEDAEIQGVCPAIFVTCGLDSLREQGEAYAQKLIRCGVPVTVRRYPEALHGFVEVNRPEYPAEDERRSPEQAAMCQDAEAFIRRALGLYL